MLAHVLRITGATAGIILCTVLPFLPGPYDSLAVPLSMIAQLIGLVGLVLVPVGAFWIAAERWSVLRRQRYAFAVVALIAVAVVWALISLAAATESLTLGF